jgi:hypothetical protein
LKHQRLLRQRFPVSAFQQQQEDSPLAQRVIQFPVRNAFAAQRSRDALARDTEVADAAEQTQRIAGIVENELARTAERLATGRSAGFESARTRGVVMMPTTSRLKHLLRKVAALRAKFFGR